MERIIYQFYKSKVISFEEYDKLSDEQIVSKSNQCLYVRSLMVSAATKPGPDRIFGRLGLRA
eukprot:SAG11_NODE_74_length_18043_cov_13.387818_8_plen_62_part_00